MTERWKQLEETIDSLVNFVRAVLVLRAPWEAKLPPQSFWIVLSNAVFDTAVIDWCKLFGSDDEKNQPTHWKNVVPNEDAFRQQLLAAVGVSWPEWLKYWAELKHYRDNAAAHHSTERRDIKTLYVVNFLEQARKFARLATDATRDWAEVVDWPRVR